VSDADRLAAQERYQNLARGSAATPLTKSEQIRVALLTRRSGTSVRSEQ